MLKNDQNFRYYDEFLARAGTDRLQKILAKYELMKMIAEVPGDIVECGVFKGSGIYTLAKINKILYPNMERKIIGFDFFGEERHVRFRRKEDQSVLDFHEGALSDRPNIIRNLADCGINNIELVAGNAATTTRNYARDRLGWRVAMLYLDVDNFEGTLAILKNVYPKVTLGGIIVFDEYGIRGHGESDAVDRFFKGKNIKIKAVPFASTPSGFVVKEISD